MYSYEERMKAIQLFIQYDLSLSAVIHELGYPSRGMLYNSYNEYKATSTLRSDDLLVHTKYSKEQRKRAVAYYLEHGLNVSRTAKALGYPGKTVLYEWIKENVPKDKRRQRCKASSSLEKCTPEQKT